MNKKMKWSIISISTATALTFGGLVGANQKTTSNKDYTTAANSNSKQDTYSSSSNKDQKQTNDTYSSSSNEDQMQTDDTYSDGSDESNESNDKQNDDVKSSYSKKDTSNQGSSWGHDQIQQAPSNGFKQSHRSSGTSR